MVLRFEHVHNVWTEWLRGQHDVGPGRVFLTQHFKIASGAMNVMPVSSNALINLVAVGSRPDPTE
jgi:hypothetical protein